MAEQFKQTVHTFTESRAKQLCYNKLKKRTASISIR